MDNSIGNNRKETDADVTQKDMQTEDLKHVVKEEVTKLSHNQRRRASAKLKRMNQQESATGDKGETKHAEKMEGDKPKIKKRRRRKAPKKPATEKPEDGKAAKPKPIPKTSEKLVRNTSGSDTDRLLKAVEAATKALVAAQAQLSQRVTDKKTRADKPQIGKVEKPTNKTKNDRPKTPPKGEERTVKKAQENKPKTSDVVKSSDTVVDKPVKGKPDSVGKKLQATGKNKPKNLTKPVVAKETNKSQRKEPTVGKSDGQIKQKVAPVDSDHKREWKPVDTSAKLVDKPENKTPVKEASETVADKKPVNLGSDSFRGKNDIAHIVSSCCTKAGFEPTGNVMRKFPKDYLETSGFRDHYIEHLSERQLVNACDDQKELILYKLDLIESLKAEKNFSAGIIAGVPGCGKSTVLKEIQGQATDTILLYANPILESCYKSLENAFYTQTALVADINHGFSTILIDEYTLCENAEILLLQRKFKSSRIFLFGDRCQGDTDSLISPEWLKIPRLYEGKKSYRFGKETAKLLKEFGLNIEGSDVPDQVVRSGYTGPVDEESTCLCFSKRTKEDLSDCSVNCELVETTQGQQFERVTLFVAEWDQVSLRNSELLLVGLTRHKSYIEIKTDINLSNNSVAEVKSHSYA